MRVLLVSLLLSSLVLSGCASFRSGEPLRVGTSATMAPVVFSDDSGALQGVEVDLAAELGRRLKRPIEWQAMPFDKLLPALERDRVDVVMAGMSVTERRQQRVLFTDPYMESGQMLMLRRADVGQLNSYAATHQADRRFAAQRGSTGSQYVFREFPNARIVYFDDTADMVQALEDGQVDYLVQDAPAIWHYSASWQGKQDDLLAFYRFLTHENLAWAVNRNDHILQQQLNQALAAMRADGTLSHIINKWLPVRAEVKEQGSE